MKISSISKNVSTVCSVPCQTDSTRHESERETVQASLNILVPLQDHGHKNFRSPAGTLFTFLIMKVSQCHLNTLSIHQSHHF